MPPPPQQSIDTDHMLPPHEASEGRGMLPSHQKQSAGPIIGTIIVIILLVLGALYFWGAHLNKQNGAPQQVPSILSGTTTITVRQ